MRPPASTTRDHELHVWHAPTPLGPWLPHVQNPVKTDCRAARPAGTPFTSGGLLYRPAQDSSRTYGGAVVLNRVVVLTPDRFREVPVRTIGPLTAGPYRAGLHTVSAVGGRTLIDAKRTIVSSDAVLGVAATATPALAGARHLTAERRSALIVGPDDFESRNVLAAVRSLGAAGWTVGIGSPRRGLAVRSRWVRHWHRVPGPSQDSDGFARAIARAIESVGYSVVFAGGDAEVLALTADSHRLPVRIPYPCFDVAVHAFDKFAYVDDAIAAGLSVPRSEPLSEEAISAISGPVLVKSRLHWTPGTQGVPARFNATVVTTPDEARRRAAAVQAAGGHAFLQEYIEGEHLAHMSLLDPSGRVIAEFQQRSARTWPPRAGVWTRAETVPLDADLAARATAFLRRIGWVGLVQLQFLVPASGEPHLIDVNGRFYASIGLAVAAGVDLPALWAEAALRDWAPEPGCPAPRTARPGMRYLWTEGDLQRSWSERRGGLLKDLLDLVRYRRGAIHSLWRREDPWPSAYWGVNTARRALRRFHRLSVRRHR